MPDKTGEEVQRGLTEGIRISTDAAKTVKSVQKVAAHASTGNYVAAGAELLKSEDTRRIITVLILAAFFMSVVIFFVAPLTLYESDSLISDGYIIHVEYPASGNSMFEFLVSEFSIPPAAAAGIMSNLWTESQWNPNALGDNGTSYGLCQWHNERCLRLMVCRYVGAD